VSVSGGRERGQDDRGRRGMEDPGRYIGADRAERGGACGADPGKQPIKVTDTRAVNAVTDPRPCRREIEEFFYGTATARAPWIWAGREYRYA
jgi:hypothetical protein